MGKLIITDAEIENHRRPGALILYSLLKLIEAGAPIQITVPVEGIIKWEVKGLIDKQEDVHKDVIYRWKE